MALAFGASIGTKVDSTVSSTSFTTTAAVASGGLIVVGGGWYNPGVTASMSGGGLTWQTDVSVTPYADPGYRVAFFSAYAPSGLSFGTSLTLTLSGTAFDISLAGVYVTGSDTTTWKDAVGAGSASTGGTWTTSLTTTNADDVVFGYAWVDFTTSSATPGSGWTEAADFTNPFDTNTITMVYQIVSSTGSYSPNGVFAATGGGSPYVAVAAAYKAAGGGPPASTAKKLAALGVG